MQPGYSPAVQALSINMQGLAEALRSHVLVGAADISPLHRSAVQMGHSGASSDTVFSLALELVGHSGSSNSVQALQETSCGLGVPCRSFCLPGPNRPMEDTELTCSTRLQDAELSSPLQARMSPCKAALLKVPQP